MDSFDDAPLPPRWLEQAEWQVIRTMPANDPTRQRRICALYGMAGANPEPKGEVADGD